MHAAAVVAVVGLGHEGGGFAVAVGHVPHHVLQALRPVGALDQRAELGADLHLAGARHFVVEHLDRDAHGFEDQHHLGAHVVRRIDRRHGKVAALDGGPVAAVAAFELFSRVPRRLVLVDLVEAVARLGAPAHAVEDEELGLGAEEGGVANARCLQVGLGAARQRARIALIRLAVARLQHVAGQHHGGFFVERVDVGGDGVGHQQHVGRFDALPAGNGGAVERVPFAELVLVEVRHRHGNVLLLAAGVGEAEIDELALVFAHELHDVGDGLGHQGSPRGGSNETGCGGICSIRASKGVIVPRDMDSHEQPYAKDAKDPRRARKNTKTMKLACSACVASASSYVFMSESSSVFFAFFAKHLRPSRMVFLLLVRNTISVHAPKQCIQGRTNSGP